MEEHLYAPVIVDQAIQCPHCFGLKGATYPTCNGCRLTDMHPYGRTPVWYGTLVPDPGTFYGSMRQYKSLGGDAGKQHQNYLAAALALTYRFYNAEIEAALGGPPTHVTPVPSSRGVPYETQPLRRVIERVRTLQQLVKPTIRFAAGASRTPRTVEPDCFTVYPDGVNEPRVLIIEDLTVGGTTAYSAWYAIREAGANAAILSIGRQIRHGFVDSARLLQSLPRPAWL